MKNSNALTQGQPCPAHPLSSNPECTHSESDCYLHTFPKVAPFIRELTLDQWIAEQAAHNWQARKQAAMAALNTKETDSK